MVEQSKLCFASSFPQQKTCHGRKIMHFDRFGNAVGNKVRLSSFQAKSNIIRFLCGDDKSIMSQGKKLSTDLMSTKKIAIYKHAKKAIMKLFFTLQSTKRKTMEKDYL